MSTSELSSLYKNKPLLLWVEDDRTRLYLRSLWNDDDIGFLVAGGKQILSGAVKDAREGRHLNVFGVLDRDFGPSNEPGWLNPSKTICVFVPPAFEIENSEPGWRRVVQTRRVAAMDGRNNYLLDFDKLSAISGSRRTPEDLRDRAQKLATRTLWWMAVRATLADAHDVLMSDFPSHPKLPNYPALSSPREARAFLEERLLHSQWGQRLARWVGTGDSRARQMRSRSASIRQHSERVRSAWIVGRLWQHRGRLEEQLARGEWVTHWSGKEIFESIAGYLLQGTSRMSIDDLVKALANEQRSASTEPRDRIKEPSDLSNLHTALRKRGGLEQW